MNNVSTEKKQAAIKVVAKNKAARFEYFVHESIEAGIALTGSEVKSLKAGKVNLTESFCFVENGEVILKNCNISAYEKGSFFNPEPSRDRKLLLHKKEILRIIQKTREKSWTLVPLEIYFKGSLAKVELGLCQGKKLYDKRETIKERDIARDTAAQMKDIR